MMCESDIAEFVARATAAAREGYTIASVEVDPFEDDTVLACAVTRQRDAVAWLTLPWPSVHLDQAERILARRLRLFGVIK